MSMSVSDPDFAKDDDDAEKRYQRYKSLDPFPDIAPALLNSADIADYVAATGMICPFEYEKALLKPASYGVRLQGLCIYWSNNNKQRFVLSKKPIERYANIEHRESFKLERNSIAFVSLEPMFRIPEYIAVRFNLKIKHVYRGLLLGTGPLVDPGFQNRLSFPLHNLTNDEYQLWAGEEAIYLEFTKLSKWKNWTTKPLVPLPEEQEERKGRYFAFDAEKLKRQDLDDYLRHANDGNPVESSIPIEIHSAQVAASHAAAEAQRIRTTVETVALITFLAVLATVGAIILQGQSLVNTTLTTVADIHSDFNKPRQPDAPEITGGGRPSDEVSLLLGNWMAELENRTTHLQERIATIEREITGDTYQILKDELDTLKSELQAVRDEIARKKSMNHTQSPDPNHR